MNSDNGKLYGNYLGIVIANNDPSKGGRVKVFVPSISPSAYNNWNKELTDRKFKFLGKNIDSDLTSITDELKDILPPNVHLLLLVKYRLDDTTVTINRQLLAIVMIIKAPPL